jgi:kynurenine formamidase
LPDGEGPAVERVTISTHNGTHLDAPWHFASTMDGGKPSWKIDQVPLEWFFSAGVKLDFRTKPDGYVCKADDVKRELDRIGHTLKPLDIVLMNTAAGAAYGDPSFLNKGCGMGREATLYLLKQGVRVAGTDAWSWDAPFSFTAKRFAEKGDRASSGRVTRRAARSAIATWRSSPTSTSCRRPASGCAASRSRSKPPPRGGPAAWRCSMADGYG